ncbi:Bifunctional inhibitor/plant lipid transfer protein/seed storage helical domain-containing protein [Hirschfeldia incana]|nr:Bifunctional inhibitor/plant lipid transfer protein/seed storage helical domain-containing protein [Hirschfeldia incana]
MANKLFLVSATLAFFFLLTNASIYRTVVEFDEDDSTNPAGPFRIPKCRKEFQQAQHLRACQQWLHKQAMQSRGGPSWTLDGEFDFEDDMENPQGPQQRPPLLQQCCNELHQEEPICVCPTLKGASKAVKQQIQQQGQQQGHQQMVSRIYQTATHLPRVCNIRQVSVCPFQKTMPGPYY